MGICFASGAHGAWAVTAVLQDAAKHRLGGKWVEVKRATPAASPEDLSPSTCSASPSSTPAHQQRQKESPIIPWLSGTPASTAAPSPQHQQCRRQCSHLGI